MPRVVKGIGLALSVVIVVVVDAPIAVVVIVAEMSVLVLSLARRPLRFVPRQRIDRLETSDVPPKLQLQPQPEATLPSVRAVRKAEIAPVTIVVRDQIDRVANVAQNETIAAATNRRKRDQRIRPLCHSRPRLAEGTISVLGSLTNNPKSPRHRPMK